MEWIFTLILLLNLLSCNSNEKNKNTINKDGEESYFRRGKGRHDLTCVLQRAVPIVESMAALVIADYFLIESVLT